MTLSGQCLTPRVNTTGGEGDTVVGEPLASFEQSIDFIPILVSVKPYRTVFGLSTLSRAALKSLHCFFRPFVRVYLTNVRVCIRNERKNK